MDVVPRGSAATLAVFGGLLLAFLLVLIYVQERRLDREAGCATSTQQPAAPAAPQFRIVPLDVTRLV